MDTLNLPGYDVTSENLEPVIDDLPDGFQSYYRDDLLNLYLALREMIEASGLPFLKNANFSDFCDFVASFSIAPEYIRPDY